MKDILEKIQRVNFDKISSIVKISVSLSLFLGFLYLVSYTIRNRIPFPFSLSDLVSALIVIMFVGSVVVLIMASLLVLPAILKGEMWGVRYNSIFIKGKPNEFGKIKRYLSITGTPVAFFCFSFYVLVLEINVEIYIQWLAWGGSLILVLFFMHFSLKKNIKESFYVKYLLVNVSVILIFTYWFCMVGLILIKAIPSDTPQNYFMYGAIPFFIIIILIHYWLLSVTKKNTLKGGVIFALIVLVIPPLNPPLAAKACEVALRLLRVGGNIPMTYRFNKQYIDSIPKEIINSNLESKQLYVVLDLSSIVYVRTKPNDEIIYGINKQVISVRMLLPKKG